MVYEYNVHIYISHFFFIRDKVECHYTLLSHFYVVLVCRRAEWHFTVQIVVWSYCKNKTTVGNPGTIGLSLINNWSVGLIKGICNVCVALQWLSFWGMLDEEPLLKALLHCFTQASFVLYWGGWNIVLRQVESKFTGFWLCVCLCLRPDMNKKKKFTLPLPQVQFNHSIKPPVQS